MYHCTVHINTYRYIEGPGYKQDPEVELANFVEWGGQSIPVEYFYGNGSPLFLKQGQMTRTSQNFTKNIIFKPQFLPGNVKRAPDNVKGPKAMSNNYNTLGAIDPQILVFLHVCWEPCQELTS